MDPLSLIGIGAAIGGASGKFAEKSWDLGEKWILSFFKGHKEGAQKLALENSNSFLNELALRVKKIEDQNVISQERINKAQDYPDFSALLQKAFLISSQTESKEKHILLARIVSERLTSESESIFSLASRMACDAISYISSNQIKLLGLIANTHLISPEISSFDGEQIELTQENMDDWFTTRFTPFKSLIIGVQDLHHLESISCLKRSGSYGMKFDMFYSIFNTNKDSRFNFKLLKDVELMNKINDLWEKGKLQKIDLTTIGQIIGVMASDLLSNTTTSFTNWE